MILIAACAVVACALAGVGALRVFAAKRRLDERLAVLTKSRLLLVDPQRLTGVAERFRRDGEELPRLAARAALAIERIQRSLRELRLPESMMALKLGVAAVRALRGLL
ncbi:MAG: hypothetical protein JO199_13800 [Candidatus Eremiobacteraeota bacterium]|nr:hypothetical protein [Candidatus Eremiobacteraeota bacterium]